MPIVSCACLCNSSDKLIRNFLQQSGYQDWISINIPHGKQKSRSLLNTIPQYPEVQALDNFIQNSSKWAIILGYNENGCRWVDISRPTPKTKMDGKHIIDTFA